MKSSNFTSTIISLFHSIEEHLENNNTELALTDTRLILSADPNNYFALAIEKGIIRAENDDNDATSENKYRFKYIVTALKNICKMAARYYQMPPIKATVRSMTKSLYEYALENKHQHLLYRARQFFHTQEYTRALQEANRALIILKKSPEALLLISQIKKHIVAPNSNEIDNKMNDVIDEKLNDYHSQEGEADLLNDKILSYIAFAEYHRTNKNYIESLRYVVLGLEIEASNVVLLQMKAEIEAQLADENNSEKRKELQIA